MNRLATFIKATANVIKAIATFINSKYDDIYSRVVKLSSRLSQSPKSVIWTWDTIKGFGKAKTLKTSYIFLFLVPVLARASINIPDSVTIPFWDKTLEIPLALPFSWIVLFVSACLASLGNVIYTVRCPKLVKQFTDYPSFEESKRDGTHLRSTIDLLALNRKESMRDKIEDVQERYNMVPIQHEILAKTLQGKISCDPAEFYFVRDAANLGRRRSRLIASIAYILAFICLGIIAVQNVCYVIQYYLPAS